MSTSYEQWTGKVGLTRTVFTPALVCLLLALNFGGFSYPWSDWRVILLLVLAAILLLIWLGLQHHRGENALMPFWMLNDRNIAGSSWYSFFQGGYYFMLGYYIPVWFQACKGLSAMESGLRTLPMLLGLIVMSITAGVGVTMIGFCKQTDH